MILFILKIKFRHHHVLLSDTLTESPDFHFQFTATKSSRVLLKSKQRERSKRVESEEERR